MLQPLLPLQHLLPRPLLLKRLLQEIMNMNMKTMSQKHLSLQQHQRELNLRETMMIMNTSTKTKCYDSYIIFFSSCPPTMNSVEYSVLLLRLAQSWIKQFPPCKAKCSQCKPKRFLFVALISISVSAFFGLSIKINVNSLSRHYTRLKSDYQNKGNQIFSSTQKTKAQILR